MRVSPSSSRFPGEHLASETADLVPVGCPAEEGRVPALEEKPLEDVVVVVASIIS